MLHLVASLLIVSSASGGIIRDYSLDAKYRVKQIAATDNGVTRPFGFSYDASDRTIGKTYPSGVSIANTFDDGGRLAQIEAKNGETLLSRYTYSLDRSGRRKGLEVRRGAEGTLARRYTWQHDGADRLAREFQEDIAGSGAGTTHHFYTMDGAGNILARGNVTGTTPSVEAFDISPSGNFEGLLKVASGEGMSGVAAVLGPEARTYVADTRRISKQEARLKVTLATEAVPTAAPGRAGIILGGLDPMNYFLARAVGQDIPSAAPTEEGERRLIYQIVQVVDGVQTLVAATEEQSLPLSPPGAGPDALPDAGSPFTLRVAYGDEGLRIYSDAAGTEALALEAPSLTILNGRLGHAVGADRSDPAMGPFQPTELVLEPSSLYLDSNGTAEGFQVFAKVGSVTKDVTARARIFVQDSGVAEADRAGVRGFSSGDTTLVAVFQDEEFGEALTAKAPIHVYGPGVGGPRPAGPVARISAPVAGCLYQPIGQPLAFDGTTSSVADGTGGTGGAIASYAWDFNGDNVPDAETASASFTYAEEGIYLATLKVTDDQDRTALSRRLVIAYDASRSLYPRIDEFQIEKFVVAPDIARTFNNGCQLLTHTQGEAVTSFGYDANGNQVSVTTGGETTTRTFDIESRLVRILGPPGENRLDQSMEYLADTWQRTKVATVGAETTLEHYGASGELLSEYAVTAGGGGGGSTEALSRSYVFDGLDSSVATMDYGAGRFVEHVNDGLGSCGSRKCHPGSQEPDRP
ncbi:MAG: PKD domain-containing protein [Planctomycetota bacterium]